METEQDKTSLREKEGNKMTAASFALCWAGNGTQQFISIPVSLGPGGNQQIQLLSTSNGQIIATNLASLQALTQPLNLGGCHRRFTQPTHTHMFTHTLVCSHTHTHMHAHTHMHVHTHTHPHTHIHVHTHTHTYMHVHTHTHTHTHILYICAT